MPAWPDVTGWQSGQGGRSTVERNASRHTGPGFAHDSRTAGRGPEALVSHARSAGWRASRLLAIAGGLAVTATFVALATRKLDLDKSRHVWASVHLWPWLPLAVASYLLGHLIRGLRCRLLFGPQAHLQVGTATNIVVVGYACNNILPLRLGELVRGGMLSERTGAPFVQSLTVIFIERLLDGIAILGLLLGVSTVVRTEGWVHELSATASVVFGVALLLVVMAVSTPSLLVSFAARLGAVHPAVQSVAIRLATRTTHALRVLRDPAVIAKSAALSVLIWVLESGLFAFLLPAFGIPSPWKTGVLAMAVTNLGIMVPSTPGFVGPFHFFCEEALASQGIAREIGLNFAVAVHLAFYVPVTLWGAVALLWYGVEVGATLALARRARHASRQDVAGGVPLFVLEELPPRPPAHVPESRLLYSIVEAVVATDLPAGGDATAAAPTDPIAAYRRGPPDPALLKAASDFLEAQLKALPALLSIAVVLGLAAFRGLVFLRYLRPFCALPLHTRKRIVEAWAFGRLGVARQFFRPLRSIACMAYFESLAGRMPTAAGEQGAARG